MYRWLIGRVTRRVYAGVAEGDLRFATALLAEDAHFRFPGRNPFAADHRSRHDISHWMQRFAHFRPQFEFHDVIASGPPWNIRACILFTDRIGDRDDPNPYVNEGVCFIRIRWGRVTEERVFLDTQAVADFFGTESPDEFFADLVEES